MRGLTRKCLVNSLEFGKILNVDILHVMLHVRILPQEIVTDFVDGPVLSSLKLQSESVCKLYIPLLLVVVI